MSFRTTIVPPAETGQFSQLFLDYLGGDARLENFYAVPPSPGAFASLIERVQEKSYDRKTLVEVLREQYAGMAMPEAQLELLSKENTFTVCTGHQLCLFTGPLYFLYKIITAIKLTEELSKLHPQHRFVPVYWMASEDHDFEEINHLHLFGKTLRWETEAKGPVGKLPLASLQPLLEELKTLLGETPSAKETFSQIEEAYSPSRTLAQATRRFVHGLFGKYGLVILDGDDARLKKLFAPQLREELLERPNAQLVQKTTAGLVELGYEGQVSPREINLFYMREGLRERIAQEGSGFRVLNTDIVFSEEEMKQELETHPERFSPNVVLRPLYQQVLLPNLAYVGGPGEIAYWLQYKAMFDARKVVFPALVPRCLAIIVDKISQERMQKLGVEINDLFLGTDELLKTWIQRGAGDALSLHEQKEELKKLFESIRAKAAAVDPTMAKAAEAELQKQLNAIENLESKLLRAEKQKQETALSQLRKLKEKFFPGGNLQERHDNFLPYLLRYGNFIDRLHEHLGSRGETMLVLIEE